MGSALVCNDKIQLVQVFNLLLCSCAVQLTSTNSTPSAWSTDETKESKVNRNDQLEWEDIKLELKLAGNDAPN